MLQGYKNPSEKSSDEEMDEGADVGEWPYNEDAPVWEVDQGSSQIGDGLILPQHGPLSSAGHVHTTLSVVIVTVTQMKLIVMMQVLDGLQFLQKCMSELQHLH